MLCLVDHHKLYLKLYGMAVAKPKIHYLYHSAMMLMKLMVS